MLSPRYELHISEAAMNKITTLTSRSLACPGLWHLRQTRPPHTRGTVSGHKSGTHTWLRAEPDGAESTATAVLHQCYRHSAKPRCNCDRSRGMVTHGHHRCRARQAASYSAGCDGGTTAGTMAVESLQHTASSGRRPYGKAGCTTAGCHGGMETAVCSHRLR